VIERQQPTLIHHIYDFKYVGLTKKIFIFYYKWFDPIMDVGTIFHSLCTIIEVCLSGIYALYDLFILPEKVIQVFM